MEKRVFWLDLDFPYSTTRGCFDMDETVSKDNSFKLIHLKKSLEIKKLGKTEKRVLVALLQQREDWRTESYAVYPKGNDMYGIATIVYGVSGRAYQNLALESSMYSTLSSVLHRLWRKGLVVMCTPEYRRKWQGKSIWKEGTGGVGFMNKELVGLKTLYWKSGEFRPARELVKEACDNRGYTYKGLILPNRTHKWWMLTENGRKIAELLK